MMADKIATRHKAASERERELMLAIFRIMRGSSKSGEKKITAAAIAREAGVSPSLIFKYYPNVLKVIKHNYGPLKNKTTLPHDG